MNFRVIFEMLKETFSEWSEDKVSRLAAALAYYTLFSIAPLLVIVIAVVGLIFGREAVQGQIENQVQGLVGEEGGQFIQLMIAGASNRESGIFATLVGLATLFLGATGLFGQLQDALNTIWEVAPKPGRGIFGIIKDRFISFTMVLGVGFLLLVSLVISAALATVNELMSGFFDNLAFLGQIINFVVSFGVITLLFAMIYKILPDVKIAWGDVWIGAAVTALLFTVGKILIGLYLGSQSFSSTYGAAGSVLIVLLWVYYSAQILLFGAEFTQVYAKRFGSRIEPAEGAIPVTEESRTQQGLVSTETKKEIEREGAASVRSAVVSSNHAVARRSEVGKTEQKPATLFGLLIVSLILNKLRSSLRSSE